MLSEVFDKDVGAQPIKITGVVAAERLVANCSGFGKIRQGIGRDLGWLCCGRFVRTEEGAVAVVILGAGIEQRGILRADGQRQAVLQRVQKDIISQDVAAHGKEE